MATILSTIRDKARKTLLETSAGFWTDAELLEHEVDCIRDLWGAIVDLHQEHFFTVDATNVSLAADTATLTGVPSDVFRVLLIEPRDVTQSASGRNTTFVPRDYNSKEFIQARSIPAQAPANGPVIYYAISQAGAPVGSPTIHIAPNLSSALNLRLVYIPTLVDGASWLASSTNPIPGESDNAIFAWTVAYARAKERDDRSPDPNWLAVYGTEKQNILTRLTPRQEQEPEYAEGMFEGTGYWQW